MVMSAVVANLKINNARLNGLSYQPMADGILKARAMGDLEMIDPNGVRATFTDKGIEVDIVPSNECCEICGDARMLTHEDYVKCFRCGFEDYLQNRNDYRPN